jgi:hypothetical protein
MSFKDFTTLSLIRIMTLRALRLAADKLMEGSSNESVLISYQQLVQVRVEESEVSGLDIPVRTDPHTVPCAPGSQCQWWSCWRRR